ncbi:DedA family protein [Pseudoneobacillus sp. C159]
MDLGSVIEFIQGHGYIALFFSFYVCLLGLPVPNEVLVMTGGLLSTTDYFHPVLTFLVVYLTVILNATILYVIGRTVGNRLVSKMAKYERVNRNLTKATAIIHRYGAFAASICYLLPVVRHFIPFLMGANRYPYHIFARYSYSFGCIWTIALFTVGRLFCTKINDIGENLSTIGVILLFLIMAGLLVLIIKKHLVKHNVRQKTVNQTFE